MNGTEIKKDSALGKQERFGLKIFELANSMDVSEVEFLTVLCLLLGVTIEKSAESKKFLRMTLGTIKKTSRGKKNG